MSESVDQLFGFFQEILPRETSRINFMPYLLAKKSGEFYRLSLAHSHEENEVFHDLSREYAIGLNAHAAEYGVYGFYEESPESCLLHKSFMDNERIFFEALLSYERCNQNSFVLGQYPLRFFCVEIPLNQNQSIHLYQHVPGSYRARDAPAMNRFFAHFFEDRYHIQVTNYNEGFNIRRDFDFCSFYDTTNPSRCFSIIKARTRKWFEKMYGYIEEYRESFNEVSRIDFLDLSEIGSGTEDTWRKCHALLRSPNYALSKIKFREALLSSEDNSSKKILDKIGIPYSTDSGTLRVRPQTVYHAKKIIQMLEDYLVKTEYGGRDGLANYIDVV